MKQSSRELLGLSVVWDDEWCSVLSPGIGKSLGGGLTCMVEMPVL